LWDGSDSQLAVTVLDESNGSVILAIRVGDSAPPVVGSPEWEKLVYVNDTFTEDMPITVVSSDTVQVVDRMWITSTANVTFTVVETWTGSLDLTDWASYTGRVITIGNTLSWDVGNVAPNTWYAITTTFYVISGTWTYDYITETLWAENAHPQLDDRVLIFQHGTEYNFKAYLPVVQKQN